MVDPSVFKHLRGHKALITGVSFSPGSKIATSSHDKSVMLWDVNDDHRAYRYTGHTDDVNDVTFAANGRWLASCSNDRTIRVWVPTVSGRFNEMKPHLASIRSVHIHNDSIASASNDKTVKVINAEKRKTVATFGKHTNWVRCARFSHSGDIIGSVCEDRKTRLFDRRDGGIITDFEEINGSPIKMAFRPDDSCLAVALTNKQVKIYDLRTLKLLQVYKCHDAAVNDISFHPFGNYLLSVSDDSTIKVLDLMEARTVYTLQGDGGPVTAAAFSPDGSYFATAGRHLLIWKTNFLTSL